MSGTSKTIVSICVLLLASLVLYYGMSPPQESSTQLTDVPRPLMFGRDLETKLSSLSSPPIAADIVVNGAPSSSEVAVETPQVDNTVGIPEQEVQAIAEHATTKPKLVTLKETVIRTYIVKEGETLTEIATRELGSFSAWRDIATLNSIDDPSSIPTGRTLRLPIKVASKKKSTDQITNAIKQNSNIALNTHRIVEGETMSSIAGDYYDNVNKYSVIAQANPNVDPARLQIGVLLVIPPR